MRVLDTPGSLSLHTVMSNRTQAICAVSLVSVGIAAVSIRLISFLLRRRKDFKSKKKVATSSEAPEEEQLLGSSHEAANALGIPFPTSPAPRSLSTSLPHMTPRSHPVAPPSDAPTTPQPHTVLEHSPSPQRPSPTSLAAVSTVTDPYTPSPEPRNHVPPGVSNTLPSAGRSIDLNDVQSRMQPLDNDPLVPGILSTVATGALPSRQLAIRALSETKDSSTGTGAKVGTAITGDPSTLNTFIQPQAEVETSGEVNGKRPRETQPRATPIQLSVVRGPQTGALAIGSSEQSCITIGRMPNNVLVLQDGEVSGCHVRVQWDASSRQWMVQDVGSLNGSAMGTLEGAEKTIGSGSKMPGQPHPLTQGNVLYLGNSVIEARWPATSEVLSPGLPSPSKRPTVRVPPTAHQDMGLPQSPHTPDVVSEEFPALRLRCAVATQVGREHQRTSHVNEDLAFWNIPFPETSHLALLGLCDGHMTTPTSDVPPAARTVRDTFAAELAAQHAGPPDSILQKLLASFVGTIPRGGVGSDGHPPPRVAGGNIVLPPPVRWDTVPSNIGANLVSEACDAAADAAANFNADDDDYSRMSHIGVVGVGFGGSSAGVQTDVEAEVACDVAAGCREELQAAFASVDERIGSEEAGGCTFSCVLLGVGPEGEVVLQAANVGDSMAFVMWDQGSEGHPPIHKVLTADHRVSNPAEHARLVSEGAAIENNRIFGLNLARTLGDKAYKQHDLGLLAEPHVSQVYRVAPDESALIFIASDGLWDTVSVPTVARGLAGMEGGGGESGSRAEEAARQMLSLALHKKTRDDCTVLVVEVVPRGVEQEGGTHGGEDNSAVVAVEAGGAECGAGGE